MDWILKYFYLIPLFPLLAAGIIALFNKSKKTSSVIIAISSLIFSLILSIFSLIEVIKAKKESSIALSTINFEWLNILGFKIHFGFILDPLSSITSVAVALIALLIFIYSIGYMKKDWNFTRFFCFMSLFTGAMLGLVLSNNILLMFIFWELVGVSSYLLIGFWYEKPSAAAAAKKAFITTRIGDLALLVGILLLFSLNGNLLFYNNGNGFLESLSLNQLSQKFTTSGLFIVTIISVLVFIGAMGKSGQVPFHIWLPDAMEGPTPVSALIHAATMVAAGVYLVARMYPLISLVPSGFNGVSTGLIVITYVGAITALLAALIAVAQFDIKRILAYSTISQLGFMMMGIGVGGVAVGIFHLITHAFFKALLFLGAGSVIHSCNGEQDIRRLGGLKKFMPVTFAVYAIGMMSLSGVPLFSGFWSKDEILHFANIWTISKIPFYIGVFASFLTAFYMTRQIFYVFAGDYRSAIRETKHKNYFPHESPPVMVYPMVVFAFFALFIGFIGTPFLPLFQKLLSYDEMPHHPDVFIMVLSTFIVFLGITVGWLLYGKKPVLKADQEDILDKKIRPIFTLLSKKIYFDEFYQITIVRFTEYFSVFCSWLDSKFLNGFVNFISKFTLLFAWMTRLSDEFAINTGFDSSCNGLRLFGKNLSLWRNGKVQRYLCLIGFSIVVLVLWIVWGIS